MAAQGQVYDLVICPETVISFSSKCHITHGTMYVNNNKYNNNNYTDKTRPLNNI